MRIHSLDGLRGSAACIVAIAHFQGVTGFGSTLLPKGTGQIGVMLFFVLSGFLMGTLYINRDFTCHNVMDFYQKRAARVIPLYLIIVVTSYLFYGRFSLIKIYAIDNNNILEHLLFWRGESVLWTIPVEVQFYFIFPFIWLIYSVFKQTTAAFLLLLFALLILLNYPQVIMVFRYLHFFLLGILVCFAGRVSTGHGSLLFICSLICFIVSLPGPPLHTRCTTLIRVARYYAA